MRRLLVFGTGAAVIGIVLLIVAFYEAYLIVSTLQKVVTTTVNTNALLEDAALEAVFLGVMAALGYGLVAKGLDGIRRQELLEMEGPVREYSRERVEMMEGVPQGAGQPLSASGPSAKAKQDKRLEPHPGLKAPVDKSVPYQVPVMPSPWSPRQETRTDEYPAQPEVQRSRPAPRCRFLRRCARRPGP